jgi:predicted RNA binding protein YcfA (HicA-like mRNA interferase family)
MAFSGNVWNQLKNLTADDLIAALEKDGWQRDTGRSAIFAYFKRGTTNQRITVHYHPRKTYGPKLLKNLLADIGWNDADLRRLKLIK